MQRTYWSMSKTNLAESTKWDMAVFGRLDSLLFGTYAACQFVFSGIGDRYDKKNLLAIAFLINSAMFIVIGIQ